MTVNFLCAVSSVVHRSWKVIASLSAVLGFMVTSTAQAQSFDCDAGDATADIQSVITGPPVPGVIIINFVGTCTGNLFIPRDDVIIDGAGGGVIQGNITAHGDRIQFSNLEVGNNGIVLDNGASVQINNVIMTGSGAGTGFLIQNGSVARINSATVTNYRNGVFLRNASTLSLVGSTIKDNSNSGLFIRSSFADISNATIENNTRFGIIAQENSAVRLNNSTVEIDVANLGGGEAAVGIFRQSLVRILGTSRIENTNEMGRAINVAQQSWLRQGNGSTVIVSPAEALIASRQSGLDLRAFNVTGNILGRDKSYIELRNGTQDGNITLRRDSEIRFLDTDGIVTVNGNLLCEDDESGHTLATGTVIVGANDCSGFDKKKK